MAGNFSHTPKSVKEVKTKYRRIVTKIPVPESIPLLEKMYKYESRSMHGQLPIIWNSASDANVFDPYGNCWIDFTSTIFVANAGHSNKKIIEEIRKLLDKPLLHTYTYASNERINYLEYLIKNTPEYLQKAYLISAGTEATETALKLSRMYGIEIGKKRGGVLCFDGAYHGRTMGAQTMSGNLSAKKWIGELDKDIFHLDFPYPWIDKVSDYREFFRNSINKLKHTHNVNPKEDVCAIMLETFQGWGAIFYPQSFIEEIKIFAKENNILIIFDEMQAGFARTGKLFGYMNYDIKPDLVCLGKGASSGFPLSIVLGNQDIMDIPDIGSMSSTHSANPIACVAGHQNLKFIIENELDKRSSSLGKYFHNALNALMYKYSDYIKYVFGEGLLAAIIFYDNHGNPLNKLCDVICEKAMQKGLLLVHTGRESIKMAPPLTIPEDALSEGIKVLDDCIFEAIVEQGYE